MSKQLMMFWLKDLFYAKGLIKYNKVNGITPMIMNVQITCLKLFALRKQQLNAVANLLLFMFGNQGRKR
jgi:hypothetical protein